MVTKATTETVMSAGQAGRLRSLIGEGWGWASVAKLAVIVALLVWPVVYGSNYGLNVMTQAGLYAIITMSVGLILGQAGQLSLGHNAFYGIGAYTCGLLVANLGVPTFAAWMAGAAAAGFVAAVIGRPVLRLKYFYLALATIALGQIFLAFVYQWQWGGASNGFGPVAPLNLGFFQFDTQMRQYYMVWVVAILILLFLARVLKYRVGRALRALAVSEIASSTLGVRNANWKWLAFVFNAIFCGLAGGLFAFVYGAVSPQNFSFTAAVLPIVMMLVGGDRWIWGSIVGSVILTWIFNVFSTQQSMLQWNGVAYSAIMILLLLFLPAGILGLRPKMAKRLWAKIKGESLQEVPVAAAVACATATEADKEVARCQPEMALPTPESLAGAATEAAGVVAPAEVVLDHAGLLQDELARRKAMEKSEGPLLRIENVSVHFGGLKAVSEVSFDVAEGSITALIGPNGAGKTTLFNAISRLQHMAGGRIWFGETELTKLDAASTARLGIARTFQNLRIFVNMSVLDNVLVGCHRHEKSGFWAGGLGFPSQRREERLSRARALDALSLVGLREEALLPASSLPYGQQRLVEIARALASEPRLLMLDEPAAGMNQSEREDLIRRISAIRDAGVTVLLVEHDMDLVMDISDQVNVLDYGRLIASGTPESVQRDEKVISAYLGAERGEKDLCATRDLVDGESCAEPETMLAVDGLVTSYGSIEALHGVSLSVPRGMVVAVLGANGAGKSTLLHTISGIVRSKHGRVIYQGADITRMAPEKIVARGLCQVPEGRQLFPTLTVEENLVVGATGRRDRSSLADDIAYVYELFPILGERRKQQAGTLSGGEQQMLAIGRALTGRPSLLLLDEPSMGLAPLAVERIFDALAKLNEQGLTMLMVEQNAEMALSLAHLAVVLQTGNVVLSGTATKLRQDDRVRASYLGDSDLQRDQIAQGR
jgi:ABC-type branched-subunit amino acid transport system ATPase component/ABC-type branched-subunit amino acid transport system permease subunit